MLQLEMAQFQRVIQNKGFMVDPLATINKHLETTVQVRNAMGNARQEEDV